jgi:hypothetical protein
MSVRQREREREREVREYSRIIGEREIHGRSEGHCTAERRKSIVLMEGIQVSLARPSDKTV